MRRIFTILIFLQVYSGYSNTLDSFKGIVYLTYSKLYYKDFRSNEIVRLGNVCDSICDFTISPDNKILAYLKYYKDTSDMRGWYSLDIVFYDLERNQKISSIYISSRPDNCIVLSFWTKSMHLMCMEQSISFDEFDTLYKIWHDLRPMKEYNLIQYETFSEAIDTIENQNKTSIEFNKSRYFHGNDKVDLDLNQFLYLKFNNIYKHVLNINLDQIFLKNITKSIIIKK